MGEPLLVRAATELGHFQHPSPQKRTLTIHQVPQETSTTPRGSVSRLLLPSPACLLLLLRALFFLLHFYPISCARLGSRWLLTHLQSFSCHTLFFSPGVPASAVLAAAPGLVQQPIWPSRGAPGPPDPGRLQRKLLLSQCS